MKRNISQLRDQGYRRFSCLGSSMLPIIRPGDELWGKGATVSTVSVGDVIVYAAGRTGASVVHRVIGVEGDLLLTQGDNCDRPDTARVRKHDILAKIRFLRRRQHIRRVAGGNRGRIVRAIIPLRRNGRLALAQALCPLAYLAARIHLVRNVFWLVSRPKVIRFGGPDSSEMKLLIRNTTIGHKKGRASGWEIRRLFRPFFDEDQLP